MRRQYTHDRRGSFMLGMAALIFVLAMLCSAVLLRSLDAYRASARLEQRLQLQAGAEGAVAALVAGGPGSAPAGLDMGTAHVVMEPSISENNHLLVPFTVEIHSSEGRSILKARYRARFTPSEPGRWKADGLERVP